MQAEFPFSEGPDAQARSELEIDAAELYRSINTANLQSASAWLRQMAGEDPLGFIPYPQPDDIEWIKSLINNLPEDRFISREEFAEHGFPAAGLVEATPVDTRSSRVRD